MTPKDITDVTTVLGSIICIVFGTMGLVVEFGQGDVIGSLLGIYVMVTGIGNLIMHTRKILP